MKTLTSNTLKGFLLAVLLSQASFGNASTVYMCVEEYEKKINKEYNVNADVQVEIKNKYGKIHVNTWDQNRVTIDVVIRIDSRSKEAADKVFDKIEIKTSGSASKVSGETIFNSKVKDDHQNKDLRIDYTVNIPRKAGVGLYDRFGDIYVGDLLGSCTIDTSAYGNLRAGSLDSKTNSIELQFSEGEIKFMALGKVDIQYSEMDIDKAGSLEVETQFSELTIGPAGELTIDSQYDEIELSGSSKLKLDTQFSEVEIEQITRELVLVNAYGDVEVESISNEMASIYIDNQFGSVEMGMPSGISYLLDAKGSFGDVDLPDDFNIKEKKKGTTSFHYVGTVGADPGSRTVTIVTNYGDVDLD